MKRRPKQVRCPTEDFCRLRFAAARRRDGFSLIELFAVAAIMLLLVVYYWGPSNRASRQRQAQKDCQTRLQKIHMALAIYASDHAGRFPELAGARSSEEPLDALVPRYTVDTAVFICPGSKDAPLPAGDSLRKHRISYSYYMGRSATDSQQVLMSDQQVNTQSKAVGDYAFSRAGTRPGNNHGRWGGNLLFCDGHTEFTAPRLPFALALTNGVVLLNPKPR